MATNETEMQLQPDLVINLGLDNAALYEGCDIETIAGRLNLRTPPQDALNIICDNLRAQLEDVEHRKLCVLTGPMAVWAYLGIFHMVVHCFVEVRYQDGKGLDVLLARHG